MKLVHLIQGSPEWIQWRREHITASNISAIMGKSPFASALDVYKEMVEGKTKPSTYAMRRGNELEPKARDWINEEMNLQTKPVCAESSEFPWVGASLDGVDLVDDLIIEIKCPGNENHLMAISGFVPDYYMSQIQWQLFTTGFKKALYVSFDGERGVVIPVTRDDVMIKEMFEVASNFYHSHIVPKIPPNPTDRDKIKDDRFLPYEDRIVDLLDKRDQIKDLLAQVEYELEVEKTLLDAIVGDRTRVCGNEILFTRVASGTSIDYKAAWNVYGPKDADLTPFTKVKEGYVKIRRFNGDE